MHLLLRRIADGGSMAFARVPTIKEMDLLPDIPNPLAERGGAALQWEALRERLAAGARSPLGRAWVLALESSANLAWIDQQQQRTAEMRRLITGGNGFEFR